MLWTAGVGLLAATAAEALTPMQVVQKALQVQQQVADYTATVTMSLAAPNVQMPARSMKVYFKRPDRLKVESEGLAIIPRDALLLGNLGAHLEGGMQATLVGTGTLQGRPVWCIKLTPLQPSPGSGRLLCWIDSQRYLLLRSEVWDAVHKAITISFTYTLVQSKYWMPRQITCEISPRLLDSSGEPARASLVFSDYRVNTGLSDALFEGTQ